MRPAGLSGALSGVLVAAGFVPVWIALGVLILVAALVAPATLSSESFSAILPLATFLAVAALGEMLVVMTGGIDLSIPGVITMASTLMIGVSGGDDGKLLAAVLVALSWSAVVGVVNGLLVGIGRLNPLVVTLAVNQIVLGITTGYRSGIANESSVPPAMASWAAGRAFGVNWIFWIGVALTIAMALFLRYTTVGRRFQTVGANPRAAWIAGVPVQRHHVFAYVAAGVLYGAAGILVAAFIRNPTLDVGAPYLLGPIAAVVIGGASLAGGLASATSTWAAAFALTFLNQMLRVLGLSSALQYAVFGVAIAAGMAISGDRIVGVLGGMFQRPGVHGWVEDEGEEPAAHGGERKEESGTRTADA